MKTLAVQAHEKRLELACDIAASVPDALVGDPLRLRQIAINLVGNGIKFTDRGEVVLRVELDSRTDNRASFHFSVSDSGVGIPKDRQRTIFTRFLQAETSTTRLYGGTGLGLTIAARLVEMMQGKIWVESEPEKGSVFHFIARFDLQPGESAALPAAKLDGLRVLVVEDHPVSRGILAKLLKEWHAEVQEAESADVALRLTKQSRQTGQPFQLILLDDTLPGIDSHVLAAQIRHAQSGTSAVMMLGFATHKDDGSSRVGADLIALTKPVKHSELRDAVISALGLSTPARRRSAPQVPVPPAEKLKILLVEDNLFSQKLARYVLQKHGHEVVVADDGVAAVEVYSRRRFDLILMDVRMPRMDGLQTTAAIRDREKHTGGHIPIIALTANAMVGDRESCLRAGMDECLIKPVRPAALIAVVDRLRQRPPCATGSADTGKPVLDHAALLERVDGDIALLDEMVGAFRRDCGRLMSGAHDAIARRDAGALAYALHTLCGMFRNLSADAAQEAVSETQKLDLENDLEGVRLRFSALENEVRLLNSRLANPHSWRAATYGQDWRGGDGKQAG
jgi:CheY-like chemotaxis protein